MVGDPIPIVFLAGCAVVMWIAIARSRRQRSKRRGAVGTIAQVLGGTVDRQGHAVGTYGPYHVEAYVARGGASPTSTSTGRDTQIDKLYVSLRGARAGEGAWACRRHPTLVPGRPHEVRFDQAPITSFPGAAKLLAPFGVAELDDAGRDRLAARGLLAAVDALGEGASAWLPHVSLMPVPAVPPALAQRFAGAGGLDGIDPATGGSALNCTVELLRGFDVQADELRATLDAVVRIFELATEPV